MNSISPVHRIFPALQEKKYEHGKGGLALRKFIFIALAVFLVLSFTAFAYAEDQQIKLGGRILVRGWYFNDVAWFNSNTIGLPQDSGSDAMYTTNAYLTVEAKITDNLQAYMELETAGGGNQQSGLYIWGTNDAKPNADLWFRQLWLQYTGSGLLGVPAGIKVGHQLLTLGEKQFYNMERFGTDAVVVFVEPTKELHIGALTAKHNEGDFKLSGDDIDANVIMGTYKLDKDNTLGLFFADVESDDVDQALGTTGINGLALYNLGIHANGKLMGALTYAAELDWQFGDLESAVPGVNDMDFGGWAIMAKLGYAIPDTPLAIRGSFAWGSGQDSLTTDDLDEFQFVGPYDSETAIARFPHYTQIYERTINTAALAQLTSGPSRNTGIANTTYYNLGIDFMPMKELSLSLDGFYLQATETGAWEQLVGDSVSENLGWEIDFKGSYKITKNLTYFVEAGYFDADNFYQDAFGVGSAKTVTQLIHGINLTF